MGRKTFESLGKPLPGRKNVVISKTAEIEGVTVFRTLEELVDTFLLVPDVWIIGGADLYQQTLHFCSDLYLSVLDADVNGDAFFPPFEHQFHCLGVVESKPGFSVHHYRNHAVTGSSQ